jgi:hypothetical protein
LIASATARSFEAVPLRRAPRANGGARKAWMLPNAIAAPLAKRATEPAKNPEETRRERARVTLPGTESREIVALRHSR